MMKKILFGVMGNMGPEADALFQDIVAKKEIEHGALKDQDHMGMLVVKNPDIPDRSEAINEGGQDPVPEMVKSAKMLERNNAMFAVMTCNTAHYFREQVQKQTRTYIVDMLKLRLTISRLTILNQLWVSYVPMVPITRASMTPILNKPTLCMLSQSVSSKSTMCIAPSMVR
ncbi:aspartate racemase [Vibrio ishigakensis]|uniref:Aspartate racemase n=1 Tax=Vibrio ishigakensis TaxID=1481914 RepID=A0A0B8NWJ0_9VIBR|nr:aspartate racemase [Vibrio ishigakensis]